MIYKPDSKPPKDKGNLAYFFFTLMGIAHLLPYNAFLTAYDYFNTNLSKVSKSFEFYISSIMTWGTFIALGFDLFLSSYFGNKKRKMNQIEQNKEQKLKFTTRIVGGFIFYILTTGSVPIIMTFCELKVAFVLMMVNVVFVGFSTGHLLLEILFKISNRAKSILEIVVGNFNSRKNKKNKKLSENHDSYEGIVIISEDTETIQVTQESKILDNVISERICQGGIFGFAAIFEPKYTTAVMSGQGFAGVIVSFLRVITKGATEQTTRGIRDSAFAYFAASAGIVFFIIVGYFFLIRTKFTKYYISKYYYHLENADSTKEEEPMSINESGSEYSGESETDRQTTVIKDHLEKDDDTTSLLDGTPKRIKLWPLYKKIFRFSFSVFFTFFISLALFPSVMVQIPSTRNHLNTTGWYSLILITLFNCLDTTGRTLPKWIPNLFSNKFLVGFVLSRSVFLVLFVLCVEKVISSDAISIIIVIIFSITNGYPSSISMMRGPFAKGIKEHERSTAAVMMVHYFITSGISCWFGREFYFYSTFRSFVRQKLKITNTIKAEEGKEKKIQNSSKI
ncbi:equilibrative nucleoside transporter 1 isoform a [Anaeramoeba flamelloides]|uniref:Equilibrative nucleoside transporter 1 isoform a n=1 Tax=Anaeramoeba flamelloides TaxID=1746091 RepID=A0AAV8ADP6_9EUKA|nr:equilibrative nucleoside transporter 1 isoform a [Anaeramoeba flamelloides]